VLFSVWSRYILNANGTTFRVNAESSWFDWHDGALSRICKLRRPSASNSQRVKIAILDTGIQLSPSNKDIYDPEDNIQYRDWIDQDDEWRDEAGHGTHLAALLHRIAPDAIIHVARVFKKNPTLASVQLIAQVRTLQYLIQYYH
jgi:hypothetical protein